MRQNTNRVEDGQGNGPKAEINGQLDEVLGVEPALEDGRDAANGSCSHFDLTSWGGTAKACPLFVFTPRVSSGLTSPASNSHVGDVNELKRTSCWCPVRCVTEGMGTDSSINWARVICSCDTMRRQNCSR